ncbi:MAG: hypothetical protein WAT81_04055 [Candidatus Moraniibacteriota bacterium]
MLRALSTGEGFFCIFDNQRANAQKVSAEMTKERAGFLFAVYLDNEGVFCPLAIPPGQLFVPVAVQDMRPGTDVQLDLQAIPATGDFSRQLAILQAMDELDGEGKWDCLRRNRFPSRCRTVPAFPEGRGVKRIIIPSHDGRCFPVAK